MNLRTPEHMKNRKKHYYLPRIGQRLIKTATAVFVCLIIYVLRGYQGMVIQSAIAAIICMQPYAEDSKRVAVNRIISTVMGGICGLLFLLLMEELPMISSRMVIVYFLMSLGVLLVLYLCVVLKVSASAALAAIVYLCIIITYPDVEAPLLQTFDRILDTIIGVCVAVLVNVIHLPVKKHPEKLFFLHLKDIAADRYQILPSRILIELNRLYDAGARICLETRWAPAFMISQMSAVRVNMPMIVMDGAALYDMRENLYHELMRIPEEDADLLRNALKEKGIGACIFAVRSNSMLIFHDGLLSEAEQWDYDVMHRSPYRNYMDGMYETEDQIIAIRFLVKTSDADEAWRLAQSLPEIRDRFTVRRYVMARSGEYTGIYFYRHDTSIENMEQKLLKHVNAEDSSQKAFPVHIQPPAGRFDPEHDAPVLLGRISSEYMETKLLP